MCKKKTARRLRLVRRLAENQGCKCFYCGCTLQLRKGPPSARLPSNFATIDHIRLRSDGGANAAENCVAACYECNNGRNNADAAAFAFARIMWRHIGPLIEGKAHG